MASPRSDTFPGPGAPDPPPPAVRGLAQGGLWTFGSDSRVITYAAHDLNDGTLTGGWTTERIALLDRAFAAWGAVIDVEFRRISAAGADVLRSPADMAVAFERFGIGEEIAGLSFFPDPSWVDTELLPATRVHTRTSYPRPEGDVFLDLDFAGANSNLPGSFFFGVMVHEIGHALGLKHPFDDGANGRPTFQQLGIAAEQTVFRTIMDYWDSPDEARPDNAAGFHVTPMVLDIQAIQAIYGANTRHRTGDDTWSGADDRTVRAIWDAGGYDTIDFSRSARPIAADLQTIAGQSFATGTLSVLAVALGVEIENLSGSPFDDLLEGTGGPNRLRGAGGADVLAGRGGDDLLDGGPGADTLDGGEGDDTFVVSAATDVLLDVQGRDRVESAVAWVLAAGFEDLLLTGTLALSGGGNGAANALAGNGGANLLQGFEGEDTLAGGAGNDTLDGGPGADRLDGGAGGDRYLVDDPGDAIDEPGGGGIDVVVSAVDFTLPAALENLTLVVAASRGTGNGVNNVISGNAAANRLEGLGGDDLLEGGEGADTLEGGEGNDTYVLDSPLGVLAETGAGIDQVISTFPMTLPEGFENLRLVGGGGGALTGNAAANVLEGDSGANLLDGQAGADTLAGGDGSDTYVAGSGDTVIERAGAPGIDTVRLAGFASVSDAVERVEFAARAGAMAIRGSETANALLGNGSRNVLEGGAGNDTLLGAGGNDTLLGGPGDDVLDGGRGADLMAGGAGGDRYTVDHRLDEVIEGAGGGADTVWSSIAFVLPEHVEDLVLTGTRAVNGAGNGAANTLEGNAAANVLAGGAGADRFAFRHAPLAGAMDTIEDFLPGTDLLLLDGDLFGGLAPGVPGAGVFVAGPGAAATGAGVRLLYDTLSGILCFDADGSGAAEAVAVVQLAGAPLLWAGGILVE